MNPRVRRLWRFLWTRPAEPQPVPSDPPSIVRRLVTGVILILLLGVGLAVALAWLARALRDLRTDWSTQLSERNAEVDRRLVGVTETMDRRLGELDTKVDRRLENASHTANKIHERLGKVDEATTQMLDRAKDLARLEQALRPPKARGGFGELLLENLLRDRLPPSAYEMQYTFDSGRAGGRDRARGPDHPGRLQVPARQLHPTLRRRDGRRAPASRTTVRQGREAAHRRDRGQVHPPGRGHLRLRVHVHPRRRRCITSSRAARPEHCCRTHTTGASSPFHRRRSPRTSR